MNFIDKFLASRWGKKLISFFKAENKLLTAFDFGFIDGLIEQQKRSRRGRKKIYPSSQLFKLCIESFSKGTTAAAAIARYVREPLVRALHELSGCVSHDVLSRFFISLQAIIKDIFKRLVKEAQRLGLALPAVGYIIDGTALPTLFRSDKDAKWNYDSTSKSFYFGYGLLLVVDPATHLPIAALFTQSKKVSAQEAQQAIEGVVPLLPGAIIGDSEFDMTVLLEWLLQRDVVLIAPYNARNTHEELPIRYRAQMYGFGLQWMREELQQRAEVEHAISTLKEQLPLLDFHVKGWKKVETHVLFVLCLRLLHGIATFKAGNDSRKVTLL